MYLKKLITKNFKALGSKEFEFSDGLVIISGQNGAGKSTLLRAVATALYGVQMLPGKREDIPTWGANGWGLDLEFSVGTDTYLVSRTQSKAEVHKNGKLEASGNTPSTKYIEDLLGFEAKDYNLLIHSRQKETGYILAYGTTALQRKVEEFAGVEVLDKVEKMARTEATRCQNVLDSLGDLEEPDKDKLDRMRSELKEREADLADLNKRLANAPQRPEQTVAQLVSKQREFTEAVQVYRVKQQRIADLEQKVAGFKLVEKPASIGDVTEKLADLDERMDQVDKHSRRVGFAKLQLKEFEGLEKPEHNFTEDDLVLTADEVKRLEILVNEQHTKVKSLEAERRDGVCNSCGTTLAKRPMDEIKADCDAAAKALSDAHAELARTKQTVATQDAQIKEGLEYSEKMQQKERIEKELATLLEQEVEDLSEMGAERQKLVEQRAAYRSELVRYNDSVDELESLQHRLKRLSDGLGEQPACEVSDADIEACEKAWEAYRTLDEVRGKIEVAEYSKDVLTSEIARVEKQVEEWKAEVKRKEQLAKDSDTASSLSAYLRTKRADYLKQIWDSILFQASTFLEGATNGWLTELAVEDSKYRFKQNDIWVPVAEASGAQEAFIGVALRIGLNKALYRGKTFIAMDEPTEAMTEENARNLVAAISGVSEQVLLVTHRETDQALANSIHII